MCSEGSTETFKSELVGAWYGTLLNNQRLLCVKSGVLLWRRCGFVGLIGASVVCMGGTLLMKDRIVIVLRWRHDRVDRSAMAWYGIRLGDIVAALR